MHRRSKALIIAIVAVIAFGTGITLCIDWGGASAQPRDYGQPPSAMAQPGAPNGLTPQRSPRRAPPLLPAIGLRQGAAGLLQGAA
jgi:hypothetical protein